MKTIKITLVAVALVITSSLFAQDRMANNVDNSTIHLQGYSPVSYLDLGIAQKGLKEFKSVHEKIIYYFTSVEQKATFDKNPNKYKPQYGGFCAFGTYAGAKFRPDPNKFIVKDGKYFLFLYDLNLDAQQLWLNEKNHNKLVAGADKNWSKLKKNLQLINNTIYKIVAVWVLIQTAIFFYWNLLIDIIGNDIEKALFN